MSKGVNSGVNSGTVLAFTGGADKTKSEMLESTQVGYLRTKANRKKLEMSAGGVSADKS
ncbi:hypothetical protein [Litchfieldia alkalitelluris]|uniref:hypothetical protein n=1 Tax=Litchfieldia alkalitelluris TaxID=304268 RepID=UPI001593DFED|nr:hypothetical protein [Litchfieldia alkalitelluris]